MRLGIDISNWQGRPNWRLINKNETIEYVYMLVSDGEYRGQPAGAPISIEGSYLYNWQRCEKPCGAYHFARPHSTNPVTIAQKVVSHTLGHHSLPLALDLEGGRANPKTEAMSVDQLVDWVNQWTTVVYYETGKHPVIYNGAFFKGTGIIRYFPNNLWWLPAYTGNTRINPLYNEVPAPSLNGNRPYDIWQFTDRGHVDGINGYVDLNVCSYDALLRLTGQATMTPEQARELITELLRKHEVNIFHIDGRESRWVKDKLGGTAGEHPDLAFLCFADWTVRQITGDEVARYRYLGMTDHGFANDSWISLFKLLSR